MKRMLTSAMAVAAGILTAASAWCDSPSAITAPSIASRLESVRVSLQFEDAPFVDVIEQLRKAGGINIAIDPRVFTETKPAYLNISLQLTDVSLRSALNVLLKPRGLAAEEAEGALLVVPKSVREADVYLVLYDVRDLLAKVRDFAGPSLPISTGSEGFSFG